MLRVTNSVVRGSSPGLVSGLPRSCQCKKSRGILACVHRRHTSIGTVHRSHQMRLFVHWGSAGSRLWGCDWGAWSFNCSHIWPRLRSFTLGEHHVFLLPCCVFAQTCRKRPRPDWWCASSFAPTDHIDMTITCTGRQHSGRSCSKQGKGTHSWISFAGRNFLVLNLYATAVPAVTTTPAPQPAGMMGTAAEIGRAHAGELSAGYGVRKPQWPRTSTRAHNTQSRSRHTRMQG